MTFHTYFKLITLLLVLGSYKKFWEIRCSLIIVQSLCRKVLQNTTTSPTPYGVSVV